MKNIFLVLIIICASYNMSKAQNGGMRVYTGITTMTNNDVAINPEGLYHSGYHIGADGRLMSGTMSFLLGVKYTAVSGTPIDGFKLKGHDSNLNLMNGRVGLDYSLYSIRNIFRVRAKVLGSFDIVLSSDDPLSNPDYRFNGAWLGGVGGIGFDIGPAILDVEYEYGVVNAYFKKSDSTFNSWSVSVGFFF